MNLKSLDILQRLGCRIRKLRIDANLSQEAFAHLCELDRTYISGIERGARNVSVKNIERISKALKISISELFEGV